jgi:hypothetical protein
MVNIVVDFIPPVGQFPIYLDGSVGGFLAMKYRFIAKFDDKPPDTGELG